MDLKALIESLASGWAARLSIIGPLAFLGLLGLYVAYLVIGYLRAAQAGIEAQAVTGEAIATEPTALLGTSRTPYCRVDGLRYPAGAAYCARCEADLVRDCGTCGTTILATDALCFSCGTRQPSS